MWEKKDTNCDPTNAADDQRGSWWDHVILDTKSRLIVTPAGRSHGSRIPVRATLAVRVCEDRFR